MPTLRQFGIYYYDWFDEEGQENVMKFLDVPPHGTIENFELNSMGCLGLFFNNCKWFIDFLSEF